MIKITTPYWCNEPQVMYSMSSHNPDNYRVAMTIAWFYFGDKYRTEAW